MSWLKSALQTDGISIMSKKGKPSTKVSYQTEVEAMKLAKANQKQGQTKEQTKLVAQGIQKGIEQYKKQHKEKLRALDKERKKLQAKYATPSETSDGMQLEPPPTNALMVLPWVLLGASWLGFGLLYLLK